MRFVCQVLYHVVTDQIPRGLLVVVDSDKDTSDYCFV